MTESLLAPERLPDPSVLVIFGASGDLTRRKLVPAVWHLAQQGRLPERFALVGTARSQMSADEFRQRIGAALKEFVGASGAEVDAFLERLDYVAGDPADPAFYARLRERLEQIDAERGTGGNRCFYCSVPPQLYLPIVEQLGAAGLHRQGDGDEQGWVRIVVEKPFGHDLTSARKLNDAIHAVFDEHQIFRIDHYLGKETVQNILVFRLANSMFEPLWNRRYVDHVQITAAEAVGVEHRAGYYDRSGALRDMIQNHLMQVMCVVAMEPPSTFDAESVRLEKLKVLKAIHPISVGQVDRYAVRGQYTAGAIDGREVPGYLHEPDVPAGSRTETYAAIEFTLDNWRWQGVPFYVRTGKRLPRRASAITLQFRQPPHLIFPGGDDLQPSTLTIRIQPDEGIALSFSGKTPGPDVELGTVEMDFCYQEAFGGRSPEAYETLLLDCLVGDATLFADSAWIERSWELLMPILEAWNASSATRVPTYRAGTWGPAPADELFSREWRRWAQP